MPLSLVESAEFTHETRDGLQSSYHFNVSGVPYVSHIDGGRKTEEPGGETRHHFEMSFHPVGQEDLHQEINKVDALKVVKTVVNTMRHHARHVSTLRPNAKGLTYEWAPTASPGERAPDAVSTRRGHLYQRMLHRAAETDPAYKSAKAAVETKPDAIHFHLHYPEGLRNHLNAAKPVGEALLLEWPYYDTPDEDKEGSYDLETEKHTKDEPGFRAKLGAIFAGKKHTDKYGGSVHLKSLRQKEKFRKELGSDEYVHGFVKKHFGKEWSEYDAHIRKSIGRSIREGMEAENEGGTHPDKELPLKYKEKVGTYDGCTVYLVSGAEVRTHFTEFATGGNPQAYPGVIPADEIWVERLTHPDDTSYVLAHELIEYTRMKYGNQAYDTAHKAANDAEACLRSCASSYPQPANESYTDWEWTKQMRADDEAMWDQALMSFKKGLEAKEVNEAATIGGKGLYGHDRNSEFGKFLKGRGYSAEQAAEIHKHAVKHLQQSFKLRKNMNPQRMNLVANHYLNVTPVSSHRHLLHDILPYQLPGERPSVGEIKKKLDKHVEEHPGHSQRGYDEVIPGLVASEKTLYYGGVIRSPKSTKEPVVAHVRGERSFAKDAPVRNSHPDNPEAPNPTEHGDAASPPKMPPALVPGVTTGRSPARTKVRSMVNPAWAARDAAKATAKDAAAKEQAAKDSAYKEKYSRVMNRSFLRNKALVQGKHPGQTGLVKATGLPWRTPAPTQSPAKTSPSLFARLAKFVNLARHRVVGESVQESSWSGDDAGPGSPTLRSTLVPPEGDPDRNLSGNLSKQIAAVIKQRKEAAAAGHGAVSTSNGVQSAVGATDNQPAVISTANPGSSLQMPPNLR